MSFIDRLKENKRKNEEAGLNDFNTFRKKLLSGGFGLAKTFWLFWLIPIVPLMLVEYLSESSAMIFKTDTISLILSGIIFVSILKTKATLFWKVPALIITGAYTLLSLLAASLFFL